MFNSFGRTLTPLPAEKEAYAMQECRSCQQPPISARNSDLIPGKWKVNIYTFELLSCLEGQEYPGAQHLYPHGVAWKTTWIKLERCFMSSDHQKEHGNQFDGAEAKWKGYARSLAICPERTSSPPVVMPGRERAASSTTMHCSFTPLCQPVWAVLSLPPAICTEEDKEKPRWVKNREDIHKCHLLMNRSIDINVSKTLHWECNCRFCYISVAKYFECLKWDGPTFRREFKF